MKPARSTSLLWLIVLVLAGHAAMSALTIWLMSKFHNDSSQQFQAAPTCANAAPLSRARAIWGEPVSPARPAFNAEPTGPLLFIHLRRAFPAPACNPSAGSRSMSGPGFSESYPVKQYGVDEAPTLLADGLISLRAQL